MLNAILRLRRDNDFNYNKIKDTFIPADGEICLVDTAHNGLRAVCGDGVSTFEQLEFLNDLIIKGYYNNGYFYYDEALSKQIKAMTIKIYIDLNTHTMYHYNGQSYQEIEGKVPSASSKIPGIMKLYDEVGQNTDGTMTQKAITDELDTKVELTLKEEEELVIFSF